VFYVRIILLALAVADFPMHDEWPHSNNALSRADHKLRRAPVQYRYICPSDISNAQPSISVSNFISTEKNTKISSRKSTFPLLYQTSARPK